MTQLILLINYTKRSSLSLGYPPRTFWNRLYSFYLLKITNILPITLLFWIIITESHPWMLNKMLLQWTFNYKRSWRMCKILSKTIFNLQENHRRQTTKLRSTTNIYFSMNIWFIFVFLLGYFLRTSSRKESLNASLITSILSVKKLP